MRFLIACLLAVSWSAFAENIGLRWDYPGNVAGLTGFRFYCGDTSGQYAAAPAGTATAAARTATLTFTGSTAGTVSKYCVARAVAGVESVSSNEVKIDLAIIPPPAPQNLETYQIQAVIDRDTGEIVAVKIERLLQ